MIPFLDLQAQYQSIREEIAEAIAAVLDSSQYVLGDQVKAFEHGFAGYCGTAHAVGVNSGTSALHAALLAAGVRPGDEVITVSHTFVATVEAICYAAAVPVFVDVEPGTCNLDPAQLEAAITSRTRAIIPVHLYGQCADMDPIMEIARSRQLVVIEDAAQAHGALYKGRRAGSIGNLGCFSFYPGKNLGAYGEAGAVVTNSEDFASALRILRDHGQSRRYCHDVVGYNYRMEGIQGAVLRVKLKYLDEWNAARRERASEYRRLLQGLLLGTLREMPYGTPVYHIFPIFTPRRDALQAHLSANGIATGIHYPVPVHLQEGYRHLGYQAGQFPEAERAARETLSFPMYAELPLASVAQVVDSVRQFLETTDSDQVAGPRPS